MLFERTSRRVRLAPAGELLLPRARSVLAAARALEDHDVVPETFIVREPTLDDVFLTLTGKPAEYEETDTASPQEAVR